MNYLAKHESRHSTPSRFLRPWVQEEMNPRFAKSLTPNSLQPIYLSRRSMAMQTDSTCAKAEDWAVLDLGLADCGPVKPAAALAFHHSVSVADPATILVGFADRCVPEIVQVPVQTWPDFAEVDPVVPLVMRRDRFDRW